MPENIDCNFPSIIRGHTYLSIRRQNDHACPATLDFHVGVRLRESPALFRNALEVISKVLSLEPLELGAASQKCRE